MHFRDRSKQEEPGGFDFLQTTEAGYYGIAGIDTGAGNWEIRLLARDSATGPWWLIHAWRQMPEKWAERLIQRLHDDLAEQPDKAPQETEERVTMEVRIQQVARAIEV